MRRLMNLLFGRYYPTYEDRLRDDLARAKDLAEKFRKAGDAEGVQRAGEVVGAIQCELIDWTIQNLKVPSTASKKELDDLYNRYCGGK